MIVDIETDADNEELSITEASLEFGVSEAVIRQAVRTHRLASIPHRWGLRVRREDMAGLASSVARRPQRQSAPRQPRSPHASPLPRTLTPRKAEREALILRIIGELGEVSISRIHQRLIESGEESIPYSMVALAMHRLKREGRLVAQEKKGRYTYRLPQPGEEAAGSMAVSVEDAAGRATPPARDVGK